MCYLFNLLSVMHTSNFDVKSCLWNILLRFVPWFLALPFLVSALWVKTLKVIKAALVDHMTSTDQSKCGHRSTTDCYNSFTCSRTTGFMPLDFQLCHKIVEMVECSVMSPGDAFMYIYHRVLESDIFQRIFSHNTTVQLPGTNMQEYHCKRNVEQHHEHPKQCSIHLPLFLQQESNIPAHVLFALFGMIWNLFGNVPVLLSDLYRTWWDDAWLIQLTHLELLLFYLNKCKRHKIISQDCTCHLYSPRHRRV